MTVPTDGAGRRQPAQIDILVEDIVSNASVPLGAYAISAESKRLGTPIAATQVYRSLEQLVKRERLERIVLLKAVVEARQNKSMFLICSECGTVSAAELPGFEKSMAELCGAAKFRVSRLHLEARGRCQNCC